MCIDAIIVTRGGGSLEELWSFNDRGVVEAAFNCQTPIVAAIGHESDTSIIELVADHRASTPTQAAMVLVPDRDELIQMVEYLNVRLSSVLTRELERWSSSIHNSAQLSKSSMASFIHTLMLRVASISEALSSRRPHALVQARQKRMLTMQSSLSKAVNKQMALILNRIESLHSRLESIGPMEVFRRGFSLTLDSSGKVIRSIENVAEGQQIRTVLADGTIESTVECTS
jgi:exodeoxyribonuclease VII large subunit